VRRPRSIGRLAVLLWLLAAPAAAQDLVADLSQRRIDISTGFSGAEVLVFGAIEGGGDVVVVARGPSQDLVVRRKERHFGIWINGTEARFDSAPGFYAVASSRPLADILPEQERRRGRVGADLLPLVPRGGGANPEEFRAAMIELRDQQGLFGENDPPASIVGDKLFSARIAFPATVVTGQYRIEALLVRDGRIMVARDLSLTVRRVGLGADLWRFAHDMPLLYGMASLLIAALAGWLGSVLFRRN
jgi:uncharacterized protein (TIGR02186 family)